MFAVILILVWIVSVGAWWLLSRSVRNADIGKIRSRLVGNAIKKEKSKKVSRAQSLIQSDINAGGHMVTRVISGMELGDRLQNLLEQAGLKWSVARLIHASLGMFLVGYGLAYLFIPEQFRLVAIVPGVIAGVLPLIFVLRKRGDRLHKFEAQFPDSLEFISRSMRAGHAFSVSLEMIHREFQEPLAGEFRRTFEEHNLGMPLEMAFEKLAKRVPSLDVHFFVSAVTLQKRTGGNLAEVLDKLAYIIRERFKLRGRIKAVSAHGKMTGMALSMIPIGVAILLFLTNPDYIRFFFQDEIGNYMLGGSVLLQLIGYGVIQKIVTIEV